MSVTLADIGLPLAAAEDALRRAGDWLLEMQVRPGVFRMSAAHDPQRWPGPLLHGTYDAVMALALLGRLGDVDGEAAAAHVLGYRGPAGIFRVSQMAPGQIWKKPDVAETRTYIDFHLNNYSLGALERLDRLEPLDLAFLEPFLDLTFTEAWLARRDLRDPWQEGNNIVNLGSFLLLARDSGDPRAEPVLAALMDWHDRHQEPATGFWGVGQTTRPLQLLHAMAGATHNLHLFYALDRTVPYAERMIDACLDLPSRAYTACLDVDPVDILAHLRRRTPHRRAEIDAWLKDKLIALLAIQSPDGGFPDDGWPGRPGGVRRLDGWPKGYEEPQGLSNNFATNFRLIAIAMILTALTNGRRRFSFRRMIGIGYAHPDLGAGAA